MDNDAAAPLQLLNISANASSGSAGAPRAWSVPVPISSANLLMFVLRSGGQTWTDTPTFIRVQAGLLVSSFPFFFLCCSFLPLAPLLSIES